MSHIGAYFSRVGCCLLIVSFSTKLLREFQIWDLITSFFLKIRKEQQNK